MGFGDSGVSVNTSLPYPLKVIEIDNGNAFERYNHRSKSSAWIIDLFLDEFRRQSDTELHSSGAECAITRQAWQTLPMMKGVITAR